MFASHGSGGMAKAVLCALHDAGFRSGFVIARNETAGSALAQSYEYEWKEELGSIRSELLVNVTPIGMAGAPEAEDLSFTPEVIDAAETVFDVVALPPETPLIRYASRNGKKSLPEQKFSPFKHWNSSFFIQVYGLTTNSLNELLLMPGMGLFQGPLLI
ncbi:hypothetical protein CIB87_16925 [Priestia megaterium]|uniref:Uncharacterized protein n=2 Tax=Bacillaceae TaxID=186817 RepID=A0AA86I5D7_PRIMG|nr:hypothetical protein CIB87_16925 [Priestia megaterium]